MSPLDALCMVASYALLLALFLLLQFGLLWPIFVALGLAGLAILASEIAKETP